MFNTLNRVHLSFTNTRAHTHKSTHTQAHTHTSAHTHTVPEKVSLRCARVDVASAWSSPQRPYRTLRTREPWGRECAGVYAWRRCLGTS